MKNYTISLDQMLLQGAKSRYDKADKALAAAFDLLPESEGEGTSAELRQLIKHLQTATENLSEMMAYRKMLGMD